MLSNTNKLSPFTTGYLPKMKLKSTAPSYMRGADKSPTPEERKIKWQREISRQEAMSILEMKMYPFKKVTTK